MKLRRAVLSVHDKRGLVELATALQEASVELVSTGGTARVLREAGLAVTDVAEVTGFPELLEGRVKTLHPRIHAGILARRSQPRDLEALHGLGIALVDLVVVNLYPFAATVARPEATLAEAIENIDVGGPTLLRAAAKNWQDVLAVCEPADYANVIGWVRGNREPGTGERLALARKVFAHTARYDGEVAQWLGGRQPGAPETAHGRLPEVISVTAEKRADLRYGENPHQRAALYTGGASAGPTVAQAKVLQGKELSYNNLCDLDAALHLALELDTPSAVIVKHANPCGVASHARLGEAYRLAREADPTSAFGGVVALNRPLDDDTAAVIGESFIECVIAPEIDEAARARLAGKRDLRLLACGSAELPGPAPMLRPILGGLLVQDADAGRASLDGAQCVTRRAPTSEELTSLLFAWRVVKHVKSNAIVLARGQRTLGIGAGQTSRVGSVEIAVRRAPEAPAGAALASDGFFPFRDGLDLAARAGVRAVVQPGGSKRDEEVIAAANEHGVAMLFTGRRHFRH